MRAIRAHASLCGHNLHRSSYGSSLSSLALWRTTITKSRHGYATNAPTPSSIKTANLPLTPEIPPATTTASAATTTTATNSTATGTTTNTATTEPSAFGMMAGDVPTKPRYEWHEFTWPKAILIGGIVYSPFYYWYNNDVYFKEEVDYWYEDGLKDVKEYIIEMITPPDAYITEDDIRKDEEAEIIRAELEREAHVDFLFTEYPDPEEESKTTWQKFKEKTKNTINHYSPIGDVFDMTPKPKPVEGEETEAPTTTEAPKEEEGKKEGATPTH